MPGDEPTAGDETFARVLGTRRGAGVGPGEVTGPTARDRARVFFRFFNRDERLGNRLDHLLTERATARDLGLTVSHGHWVEVGEEDNDGPLTVTMLHDALTGRLVAIIEMTEQGDGCLYLED
jgi:hypothetical protein